MTVQIFLIDMLAGACLYAAVIIVMHKRPIWQRTAVYLLLLFAITLMVAAGQLIGKVG